MLLLLLLWLLLSLLLQLLLLHDILNVVQYSMPFDTLSQSICRRAPCRNIVIYMGSHTMRFDIGLQLKLLVRITWSNTCFIRLKNDSSSLQTVVGCNRAIGTFADAFDRASTSTSSWVDMSACAFVLSRIALVAIIIGTVAATAATIRRCGRISQRSATDGTSRTRAAFATEYLLVSLSMSTSTSTSMKTNMLRAGRHSFLLHDKRSCLRKHLSWLVMGRGRSRWMLQPQLPLLQLGIRSAAMRRLWVILRKSQHSIPSISDDAPSLQIQDHGIFCIQRPHIAEGIHGERGVGGGTRSVRIARSLGVVRLEGGRASGRREAVEICEGGVGFAAEGALDGSALRGHWGVW
mmetsp:Transcript_11688/g.24648  ORF Transcript_11688/g.24648 Transcript_11688/m.24648 type:complete len:349 (-) Transcript_11688:447-1493(-)